MTREWYLIVGLAKTGTTAIAMTLRNTLRVPDFCMEPTDFATIERYTGCERLVIKIIFDHWRTGADELKTFVRSGFGGDALTTIAIVRDPRDEAISRLHYAAYNYFATRQTTDEERAAWIEIFRSKEEAPNRIGLLDMQDQIKSRFGLGFLPGKDLYETYIQFIDDIVSAGAPGVHLLRYEDFVRNEIPNDMLRAILSGSNDVGPQLRRVYRSGSSGAWRHFLTDRDLPVLNKEFEPFLSRFEYPFERTDTLEGSSRATGSDYVERLIDEARSLFEKTCTSLA
jgi:hypothetical protein